MKIGLLTYHHVINPGSVLQAYCGYKLLQNFYPKDCVEIIDYYPEASQQWIKNSHRREGEKFFQEELQCFLRRNCIFSDFQIRKDNYKKSLATIDGKGYDRVFVGSDTVFQVNGYLGRFIAGPKAPNLYYLPGATTFEKYGFAVSFDPPQNISEEQAKLISFPLRDFKAHFYRDEHAYTTLVNLGIEKERLIFCPDPTLLVDIHNIIPPVSPNNLEFTNVVGVSIGNGKLKEDVICFLETNGFKTIDLMHLNDVFSRDERELSFESKLWVYRKISGLVTDRFHGSILGMKLGDYPIVGIEDDKNYPVRHGKLWDLYDRLGYSGAISRSVNGAIDIGSLAKAWEHALANRSILKININKLRTTGIDNLVRGLNL